MLQALALMMAGTRGWGFRGGDSGEGWSCGWRGGQGTWALLRHLRSNRNLLCGFQQSKKIIRCVLEHSLFGLLCGSWEGVRPGVGRPPAEARLRGLWGCWEEAMAWGNDSILEVLA